MLGIRGRVRRTFANAWLAFVRLRHPHATLGNDLVVNGLPILAFGRRSRVKIGNRVILTSGPRFNMAGLSKRCSICVLDGAELEIGDDCGLLGCLSLLLDPCAYRCARHVWSQRLDLGHRLPSFGPRPRVPATSAKRLHLFVVEIGNDVFVGANSMILKGVTIGSRAVIGAGSVVVSDVPSDEIWAGDPARFLRRLDAK